MTVLPPDQWARNLIRATITPERVAAVMAQIAGERIEVGPLRFGPGGTVAASGVGVIGPIRVTTADADVVGISGPGVGGPGVGWVAGGHGAGRRVDDRVPRGQEADGAVDRFASGRLFAFDAVVPGDLTIFLTAGSNGRPHRYEGTVVVAMQIAVVLEAPTQVVLDVAPLQPADVVVRVRTFGVATFVLQTLGDADREVAAQVARVVNDRVAAVADLRRIDLATLLDRAWDTEVASRLRRSAEAEVQRLSG